MRRFVKVLLFIIGIICAIVSMYYTVNAASVTGTANRRSEGLTYTFERWDYRILKDSETATESNWLQEYYELVNDTANCSVCGPNVTTYISHFGHDSDSYTCTMTTKFEAKITCSHKDRWASLLSQFATEKYNNSYYVFNMNWNDIRSSLKDWITSYYLGSGLHGGVTITVLNGLLNDRTQGYTPLEILQSFASVFCLRHHATLVGASEGNFAIDHASRSSSASGTVNMSGYFNFTWTNSGDISNTSSDSYSWTKTSSFQDTIKDYFDDADTWIGISRTAKASNQTFKYRATDLSSIYTSHSGGKTYDLRYAVTYTQKYNYLSGNYSSERTQLAIWGNTNGKADTGISESDADEISGAYSTSNLYYANAAFSAYDTTEKDTHGTDPTVETESTTGTTLQSYDESTGIATYRVGPFDMSDYAYAYNSYVSTYSGSSVSIYQDLLGGIISGYITVSDDSGNTTLDVEVASSSSYSSSGATASIVYSGTGAKKGDSTRKYVDSDGDTIWTYPTNYIFPWPNSVFYIELQLPLDYTQITEIGFEYRETTADGEGWVIESRYLSIVYTTTSSGSYATSCEYDNPCTEDLISTDDLDKKVTGKWEVDYYGDETCTESFTYQKTKGGNNAVTCTHKRTVYKYYIDDDRR